MSSIFTETSSFVNNSVLLMYLNKSLVIGNLDFIFYFQNKMLPEVCRHCKSIIWLWTLLIRFLRSPWILLTCRWLALQMLKHIVFFSSFFNFNKFSRHVLKLIILHQTFLEHEESTYLYFPSFQEYFYNVYLNTIWFYLLGVSDKEMCMMCIWNLPLNCTFLINLIFSIFFLHKIYHFLKGVYISDFISAVSILCLTGSN